MNFSLFLAGTLAAIGALIHAIAGEKTDIKHLMESEIPKGLKLELRGTWYIGSVVLALTAIVLLWFSFETDIENAELLLLFFSAEFIIFGVVFLGLLLLTERGLVLKVPQWLLLLVIGLLCWLGTI